MQGLKQTNKKNPISVAAPTAAGWMDAFICAAPPALERPGTTQPRGELGEPDGGGPGR